jgi:ABC-type transport system substrate-binding protein
VDIFFDKPIGSGPFKFKSRKDNVLTLEAFKDYFLGRPYIDTLIFKPMTASQAYTAFEFGEVHDLLPFMYDDSEVRALKEARVVRNENGLSLILFPNIEIEPFNRFENRLLLLKTLNMDNIYNKCSLKPVHSIIPYSIGGYLPDYAYPEHKFTEQQKNRLIESFPPTTLYYPDILENYCLIRELKNTLTGSPLLFTSKVVTFDEMEKSFITKNTMPLFINGILIRGSDAFSILRYFYGKNNKNFNKVNDPEINKLYESAKLEKNSEIKYGVYQKINKILLDKIYAIPLLQQQQVDIFRDNVYLVDREYSSKYLFDFSNVWLK